MAIKINGQDLKKRYINWQEIVRIYKNGGEIRPNTVPPTPALWYLSFSPATSAWCTVALEKSGNPDDVYLEISYDWSTWNDYTIGSTISLSSGERVYMRNKSTEVTWFSWATWRYSFNINWDTNSSWDINYLICKESSDYVTRHCYESLFSWCTSLITAPSLPATRVDYKSYWFMFEWCTSLINPPSLPATSLGSQCYGYMFARCTSLEKIPLIRNARFSQQSCIRMFSQCDKIKISKTRTGDYQNEYTITGSVSTPMYEPTLRMFADTWWTFTGTPTINTTYYTSNTVI